MSVLENYIADSMDEAMQPYLLTDEYTVPRAAISQKLANFRATLGEAQQREFNLLMDMINNADVAFALKAYVYGAVNSMALGKQVLEPQKS